MLETIRLLYDYTRWADGKMLDVVSKLSPEQWTRDLGSSLKSARDTVAHIASAQWLWLSRWKGEAPRAMWPAAEFPSPAAVLDRWAPVRVELATFVAAQTEETLQKVHEYRRLNGEPMSTALGLMMLHVVNHSTYHRGQVTTLMRQLGAQPVSTDLIVYHAEKAKNT